jgi:hypothetical protein
LTRPSTGSIYTKSGRADEFYRMSDEMPQPKKSAMKSGAGSGRRYERVRFSESAR